MSVIEDIQHRSAHIRWPEGIVPEQADPFARLANTNPGHMHRGHDLWNISLKFLCESTQD